MSNSGGCAPQTVKQMSALDQGIDSVLREVNRYETSLRRLIDVLEAPRPCNTKEECCPRPQPLTLDIVLSELHGRLVEATDLLNHTTKRVEEQVGELKLLP